MARIDRLELFLDSLDGGAWPLLVGEVTCLVDSDNERDLCPQIVCGVVHCRAVSQPFPLSVHLSGVWLGILSAV